MYSGWRTPSREWASLIVGVILMLSGGGIGGLGVADELNGPEEATVPLVVVNDQSGQTQLDPTQDQQLGPEQPTLVVQAPAGESKPSDFIVPGGVLMGVGGGLIVAGSGGAERERQRQKEIAGKQREDSGAS